MCVGPSFIGLFFRAPKRDVSFALGEPLAGSLHAAWSMPEVLSKHPDVALQVLKEQGAQCGVGVRPKILKACPQEKFCLLKGGELCVYGPTELGQMTQLSRNEVCGPVPTPRSEASFAGPAVGLGLGFVAVATAAVALASVPMSGDPSHTPPIDVPLEPKTEPIR
jgi:hypothetical protein